MKIVTRFILGLFALSLLIFAPVAMARPSNAFYLRNGSSTTLHFSYGCDGSRTHWNRALAAHAAKYYWANNGCRSYTITKATTFSDGETKSFTYTIDAGHRYEIFWDRSKKAWNIQEL